MPLILFKDGDERGIQTDAENENELILEFSEAISKQYGFWKENVKNNDFLEWLLRFLDIACALRGYKTSVEKKILISSGHIDYNHIAIAVTPGTGDEPATLKNFVNWALNTDTEENAIAEEEGLRKIDKSNVNRDIGRENP